MNRILLGVVSLVVLSFIHLADVDVNAQEEVVNAVWVMNEGGFVETPSVGVYNPTSGEFTQVMEFENASFTTDVIIGDGAAFAAADNMIYRFNLDTYEVEAIVELEGVRKLAYDEGVIYATRGEYDPETWGSVEFETYFIWFNAETLLWEGELPATEGVGFDAEGLVVKEGIAYIAINHGFTWGAEVGLLGVYNIETGEYTEHDLGENGKNPVHLKVTDNEVLMVNNTDWSGTSLSRIELPSLGGEEPSVNTMMVTGVSSGCNAASLMGDKIVFQIVGELGMRKVFVSDLIPSSEFWGPATDVYYSMAVSPVNGDVYATVTNFDNEGEVQILNSEGTLISTFQAGSIPGGIAFDVRTVVGIVDLEMGGENMVVGEFDLMGRVWAKGNIGVKLEKMSDGTTIVIYVAE
jgi:DNA-binding beta-propeller fold protein YncE